MTDMNYTYERSPLTDFLPLVRKYHVPGNLVEFYVIVRRSDNRWAALHRRFIDPIQNGRMCYEDLEFQDTVDEAIANLIP